MTNFRNTHRRDKLPNVNSAPGFIIILYRINYILNNSEFFFYLIMILSCDITAFSDYNLQ
jgi:hypothetical protein